MITEFAAPGLDRAEQAALYEAMVATMAALPRLDYAALGLADYGRPATTSRAS